MFRLIVRGLWFHRRAHAGVLMGALIATAVLTGALFVGDSVDGALANIAKKRLGGITHAVDTRQRFFNQRLGQAMAGPTASIPIAAALHLRGMAIREEADGTQHQVNRVQILGIDSGFFAFAEEAADAPKDGEALLGVQLARALGATVGGQIALRAEQPGLLSRDAPLASHVESDTRRTWVTVSGILGDEQLGPFSLAANQQTPNNVFVNRGWLQKQVELTEQVNLLLAGGDADASGLESALKKAWKLEDFGLHLRVPVTGTVQLESDRIYIEPEVVRAATAIEGSQPTLAYLVDGFTLNGKSTPYAFVVAGPVAEGLADGETVINRWLADQLGAKVGDTLTMTYQALLPGNNFEERTADLTVRAIREMDTLEGERALVPTFPGLSDVDSCRDWNIGLPMDDKKLEDEANETYWEDYGTTPKAFITLAEGQKLWSNRFGAVTAIRFGGGADRETALRAELTSSIDPARLGLYFRPVAEQADTAVAGAMDFGGLFLGMSFFLIVAALIFTGMLYVFGVQHRSPEMGLLLAVGYTQGQVRRIFFAEATLLALGGAVLGAGAGAAYTALLLYGLSAYWQGAVASISIPFHASAQSAVIGASASFLCALGTMTIALRRQGRHSARELLNLDFTQESAKEDRCFRKRLSIALIMLSMLGTAAMIVQAQVTEVKSVAETFFSAGALLLIAGILLCRHLLYWTENRPAPSRMTLFNFALQNLVRRKGRSLGVIGLLATGFFLVFAVASMQEDLSRHADERSSGTGGFALFAQTTLPLTEDPAAKLGAGASDVPIKVHSLDDASCLNLNHAPQPTLLGVPSAQLSALGAFLAPEGEDLWRLLEGDLGDGIVPALVGDADTAMWGMKAKTGIEDGKLIEYQDDNGQTFQVRLVGHLPMRLSVFQGSLLISNAAFSERFPSETGHRMFLVDVPKGQAAEAVTALTKSFGRAGMDAMDSVDRLRQFYVVEQTYLGMFLALGALGMLLGGAGMAVVVLRNLFERRRELALLAAVGYPARAVLKLLLLEHGLLLALGFLAGGASAAVSMAPALLRSGSNLNPGQLGVLAAVIIGGCVACTFLAVRAGMPRDNLEALRNE